jgi:small-conductance mechanosensitive channel
MAIILYGLYMVWKGLTGAILQISQSFKEYYISHYWEKLERRFTRIVLVVIILFWLYYIALLFEVDKPLLAWLTEFLIRERSVGTLEISVSSILTFLGILAVTFFFTGVIRFIIDDEFISKSKLPRGLAAAISATLRYVIIILGVMFALSAAGIDLGKFSLIAGALGLGIGFGLQNLVNNFISGLILVYERPIQVGDTIEIESLLGRVKKIGLRSSQVITYDGAEVVVPNGNLISNQLINWTLSNKQRRIKIQVGASYGSDPNVVLRLLEEVANSHSNILKDPPPLAVFDGFGESSLDFTLLFWVPFDLGILTKSQVSVAIYSVFKANGIEIPFPQLDLHVKEKNSGKLTES